MTLKTRTAESVWDGWILLLGGLGIAMVLWLAPAVSASSRNGDSSAKRDFNNLVQAISSHYHMRVKPVPMMWVANLCASRITHGGVSGIKVVEFEDAGRIARQGATSAELGDLIKSHLGGGWSPMLRENTKSDDSYIYVQNATDGDLARLIVVDLDGNEMDVVAVSLKPDQLKKWLDEQDAVHKKTPAA